MLRTSVVMVLLTAASVGDGCQRTGASQERGQDRPAMDTGAPVPTANRGGTEAKDGSIASGGDASAGVVIATAGDIACANCAQSATADLLDGLVKTQGLAALLPLGDNAYASGSLEEMNNFYRPAWGRPELLAITHPVPGNHEYAASAAAGYFDFFDGPGKPTGIAGPRGLGYYSFDLAGWHLIALNTSDGCTPVSCAAGSPQHQWLVGDLAAHPARCTLAFWHHPRFQAGVTSGEETAAAPLWDALFDAGADVVLNGHEHGYQQLAPLDKSGAIDRAHGMRTFVVGTGGAEYDTGFGGPRVSALEAKIVGVHGVLVLTLRPDGYDWRFLAVGNSAPAASSGTSACH